MSSNAPVLAAVRHGEARYDELPCPTDAVPAVSPHSQLVSEHQPRALLPQADQGALVTDHAGQHHLLSGGDEQHAPSRLQDWLQTNLLGGAGTTLVKEAWK